MTLVRLKTSYHQKYKKVTSYITSRCYSYIYLIRIYCIYSRGIQRQLLEWSVTDYLSDSDDQKDESIRLTWKYNFMSMIVYIFLTVSNTTIVFSSSLQ